ncbi:L-arabinokinase [Cardamine amara subsp. amara]|uniref:L-arabinokinase n=1 Tax=Cardamine amara subsp. amara TaxID=228776 RepID=A0ABD1AQ89_CARAN
MPTLLQTSPMAASDSSSSPSSLVFAYYVTGHGFGHATRVVEVVRHLISSGHRVYVVSAAPEFVFTMQIHSRNLFIRKVLLDSGSVQADALTVDRRASLEKYSEIAVEPRDSILATEVEWLKSIKANLVVSDVVPIACRAAANAGIRSICVTNFSWDFIYAEYVMAAGHHHRSIVWQIAEDYSHCEFLIRLPGYCPMPAFHDVVDIPLVVRPLHKSRQEVRKELRIPENMKLLIFNFGGQPTGWKLKEEYLPAGWLCLVCGDSAKQELPSNFIALPKDAYTPDVIAASDCMLGKIGYGTLSEALAYKLRFIFVRRDYFNEEPFLRKMLEYYQGGVEMIRRDLLAGCWAPYLERAVTLKPCYDGGIDGGEVAAKILQDTAFGKKRSKLNLSGARRLQDEIILGFQLQRAPGRDHSVPEWYQVAGNEAEIPLVDQTQKSSKFVEGFEILHGDHHGLLDTIGFLDSLATLAKIGGHHQEREHLAAAALFNWEEDIVVARAPGRLDVMGGIADYSGSLVLLMPTREACHAAVQRNHPSKQKLCKHTEARHHSRDAPILEIVSFGSELSNRGPTFDMDLSDFMEENGKPISYEKAYHYFSRDPSQKWAAYVAGTILVLMREMGVRFEDSISILVSSTVPEGKGVSSSASVEVATMSAVTAAHGLEISPRDVALLCQKVENYVVGAPCGVMDQMASACGEANKLLAMICQPAEILGLVEIPSHIQFWGIDSGIRHSVGGSDYGSVRIGAFIGKTMIRFFASSSFAETNSEEAEEESSELIESDASLDYLCNLSPHRFQALYASKLPKSITGEEFIEKYGDHGDSVTTIEKKCTYEIMAPTRHPIYENFRVQAFKALLTATPSEEQVIGLGELMYQCHDSYSACKIGSDGTDRLVRLVQNMEMLKSSKNENGTLYGAKITGGGSGGTVCVIGRSSLRSNEQILQIQTKYKEATGFMPYVFEGSSPGAGKFGYLKIRKNSAPPSST